MFITSADEFWKTVQLGSTTESPVLEFKGTIDGWNAPKGKDRIREEAQKETCRDIAQFANAWGGCLLVGVEEDDSDPKRRLKVAQSIRPVVDIDPLRQWIEQAITNYLVPATLTHDLTPITLKEGTILAINVPASRHLVSLWDRQSHTVEYLRRTSHGKAWMNPDEAERHLMDGSRAVKLTIHAARDAATADEVELQGGVWQRRIYINEEQPWHPPPPIKFGKIKEHWFELRITTDRTTETVTIPYEVVEAAWVNNAGRVAILLSVRLIFQREMNGSVTRITTEPPR